MMNMVVIGESPITDPFTPSLNLISSFFWSVSSVSCKKYNTDYITLGLIEFLIGKQEYFFGGINTNELNVVEKNQIQIIRHNDGPVPVPVRQGVVQVAREENNNYDVVDNGGDQSDELSGCYAKRERSDDMIGFKEWNNSSLTAQFSIMQRVDH